MDSKEKENIKEEELKTQDAPNETVTKKATEKQEDEVPLTEEEKLAQELEKANARLKTRKTSTCASLPSSTTTVNVR